MYRLSSNATLFLKIFLPVFWTTVMLGVTLVTWFAPEHYFGGLPLENLRWAVLFTLLTGVAGLWLLFWPLKRVESNDENVYVSNYFRTAYYHWERDVRGIEETRFLGFTLCYLHLNGVGSFGRTMRFLAARKLLDEYRARFPGRFLKAGE